MSIQRKRIPIHRPRLERLLRGMKQIAKYSLPGMMLSLAGCLPSSDLISVSPDGRYLVVPMNKNGVSVTMQDHSRLVRIDLKTNEISVVSAERNNVFWVNTVGDVVTYSELGTMRVIIQHGEAEPLIIEKATFPTLSADARYVFYCRNGNGLTGAIIRREVTTGKEVDLILAGAAPLVSPDGKRLLFIHQQRAPGPRGTPGKWTVDVADIDGKNHRTLADIEADGMLFRPRWIDDQSVIYQARTDKTGPDAELFITTLDGKTEQVTDDEVENVTPVYAGKDRVIWRSYRNKQEIKDGDNVLPLSISERHDGKWQKRELGIVSHAFTIVGDDIIYVVGGEKGIRLLRAPLAHPNQTTDLGKLILEKATELPPFPETPF